MNVGEKIKSIRKSKKMSQGKLGALLGVSQAMIAQYENGQRMPKIETLQKIANALEVDIFDLMEVPFEALPDEDIPFKSLEDGSLSLMTKNENEFQMLADYRKLNPEGQRKVIEHVELLTKIPEYLKEHIALLAGTAAIEKDIGLLSKNGVIINDIKIDEED